MDLHEYPSQQPGTSVSPADELPQAVGRDATLRAGQIGTSLDYAREDHKHAMVRQTLPPAPSLIFAGAAGSTMVGNTPLRTWSTSESVKYLYRPRLTISAANGWNRIIAPNLAGFQNPIIHVDGEYRYSGTPTNRHVTSAVMGNEAVWWSGSTSVYLGKNAGRTAASSQFSQIFVEYIRT